MNKKRTILCVDDDDDDLQLLQEAIKEIDGTHELLKANDGVNALKMLREMQTNGTLPCLIVLDINMPKMDGRQTFVTIKADAALATIPVVVFSTSSSPLDKMFFAKKDVEYITKPINYAHLLDVARRLLSYCA